MRCDPSALKDRVSGVLAGEIAPALGMDGTSIEVVDVADGLVRLRLGGGCGCCPSSIMAIVMGIEQELRRLVPGVDGVEVVP
jgi:Fe-S cluster biogenesis protein NfuA